MIILFLAFFLVDPVSAGQFKTGDQLEPLKLQNIHGKSVQIPDAGSKCVHIQFRRFSGCSICNLHLQRVLKRLDEIKSAGIREVVFFHSSVEELMPFQGKFDLDVIADPEKIYYKKFGVRSSILSILNPGAWLAMIGGVSEKERPQGGGQSGHLGLPADFMISREGKIIEAYYGEHAADQWSVKQILEKCTP